MKSESIIKKNAKLFNLNKLYVFGKVFKKQSITQAANELFLTQPAVSNIIKQIENHFDIRLFHVIGKKLHPTESAKQLYEEWVQLKHSIELFYENIESYKSGLSGSIHLVIVSSAKYFAPKIIGYFLKEYPNVKIQCTIEHRENIIHGLENFDYELGIMTNAPYHNQLDRILFSTNKLSFISHPDNTIFKIKKVKVNDLSNQKFIVREKNALISQELFEFLKLNKITPNILYEIDSTEAIKQSVISNLGIALVPRLSVENELKFGILKEIPIDLSHIKSNWHLMFNKKNENFVIIKRFMKHFYSYFNLSTS